MKKYIILSVISILILSCSKEYKLKKEFQNKIFIIDSIQNNTLDIKEYGRTTYAIERFLMLMKNRFNPPISSPLYYILKTSNDSIFELYKKQNNEYDKYKIENDIVWLHKTNSSKYEAYHLIKIDDYTYKLEALSIKTEEQCIKLTDVTDLINRKVDNSKSELLAKLNNTSWYPLLAYNKNATPPDTSLNDIKPKYYIDSLSLTINDKKTKYYSVFKNKIIKFTNSNVILYDTLLNEMYGSYNLKFKNPYEFIMTEIQFNDHTLEFKKIDPSILVNYYSLPKNERLRCTELEAELGFKKYLSTKDDGGYAYNLKSVKFIDSDSENCVYKFSVKYYFKELPDIYEIKIFDVSFEDDYKIHFSEVK